MAIKFLNEVFEEIDKRGIISLPKDGICGDDYEEWLCKNEIKEISKIYSECMYNTEKKEVL